MKPTVHQAGAATVVADLNEILFEHREKRYGAYLLRRNGDRALAWALLLTVAFVAGGLGLAMARRSTTDVVSIRNITLTPTCGLGDRTVKPPVEPPLPLEKKLKLTQQRTVRFVVPEPVPASEIHEEEAIAEADSLNHTKAAIGSATQDGADAFFTGEDIVGTVPDIFIEERPAEPEPDIADVMIGAEEPQPVNLDDIRQLVGYPQIARDAGIEGMVVVRILVDERGSYVRHKVIKQAHPILTEACEKQLPRLRFTPAIQGNRAVKFWVNVPFKFSLVR